MRAVREPQTCALYRFFAADGALLYVGLTINPGRRMEKHRADKPWWNDVARIEMEQHSNIDALRAAERAAIRAEKPLYNIRMNGATTGPETAAPAKERPHGLVGRSFHTWRPARDDDSEYATRRGDRVLEQQGRVLEQIDDGLYLIQTYSWLDGREYGQTLVEVSDMAGWTFYPNNVAMVAGLGCREMIDNGRGQRECGAEAEYLVVDFGLGTSAACHYCAGHYSAVQQIIWRNGVPELGPKTTVAHPLSAKALICG